MNDSTGNPPDGEMVRFGVSRAIQVHSEAFRAKYPQIKLDLDLVEDENLLPQATCLAFYQVYLERLQQIAEEPQTGQVWVHYYPSRDCMMMEIKDDGKGASTPANAFRMKECIEAAGGQLSATTLPDGLTMISAKVPFRQ
jgi:glucose-6-phosphate-specific signal transduction histidine kinase